MNQQSPEIGLSIQTGAYNTNYHDWGEGDQPVLLLHGPGPGVSAWANWRYVIPQMSQKRRILAMDMAGFGYTDRLVGMIYKLDLWMAQVIDFLDAKNIEMVDLVGNSFGGAVALALAVSHPERIRKLVVVGSMGVSFDVNYGLNKVWGYTPSIENMTELLNIFVYNKKLITDELIQMRYNASIRPGFQESFSTIFPEPRQAFVEHMAKYQDNLRDITHPTLVLHGREDRVVPMETSLKIFQAINDAQLHIFGRCGQWMQSEHPNRFMWEVENFLAE